TRQGRLESEEDVGQDLLAGHDRRCLTSEQALAEVHLQNVETEAAERALELQRNELQRPAEIRLLEQLVARKRLPAECGARRSEQQEAEQLRFGDLSGLTARELQGRRLGGARDTDVHVELPAVLIEHHAARGDVDRRI